MMEMSSNMVKSIVVDDEWYNLEETSELIEKTGYFHVEGKYQNPLKALDEMPRLNPQVAFIDIELPEMDGITLAEKLVEMNSSLIIVFITSYNQYAVQAFDLNAIDYILKPIKMERFNRMIGKLKNEIEVRTQYTSKSLRIKCFSHLSATIGDIPVKWERAKAEELFAYLLMCHGRYIHKERIIEDLWSGYEPEKALQILQTSVCKVRTLFSQIKNLVRLDYSGSRYCLIIEGGECDYFQVESAIENYSVNKQSTYDAVEKACLLYGSGFLTEDGYIWSIEKDVELQEKINTALYEIVDFSFSSGNNERAIRVLKLIAKLTPFDERINRMIINVYNELGDRQAAYNHYKWLERILKDEYDTTPPETLKAMLKSMGENCKNFSNI